MPNREGQSQQFTIFDPAAKPQEVMDDQRIVIYPKDLQVILGKSESSCRRLLVKIKRSTGKQNHGFVTIDEFCAFTGLQREEVNKILSKTRKSKVTTTTGD